jgi:beta-phosphoglucomutase-like phosphatase (HAD superfamily)
MLLSLSRPPGRVSQLIGRAIFDLDGTVVDTEPLCHSTIVRCLSRWNVSLPPGLANSFVGVSWARAADLLAPLGLPVPADEAVRTMTDEYARSLRLLSPFELRGLCVPGVVDCIRRLSDRSVPLALVSGSASADCEFILTSLGVRDHFSLVLGFEHYRRSKPSPDGFQLAVDTLQHKDGLSLIFEDSAPGIQAAIDTKGAVAVAIRHCAHGQDQSKAHLSLGDFAEVTNEWLERVANTNTK